MIVVQYVCRECDFRSDELFAICPSCREGVMDRDEFEVDEADEIFDEASAYSMLPRSDEYNLARMAGLIDEHDFEEDSPEAE